MTFMMAQALPTGNFQGWMEEVGVPLKSPGRTKRKDSWRGMIFLGLTDLNNDQSEEESARSWTELGWKLRGQKDKGASSTEWLRSYLPIRWVSAAPKHLDY